MEPSLSRDNKFQFTVRNVLFERASFYSASVTAKRKLVDRTLDLAALDASLFLKPDVVQELFKLLHKVAQEELGVRLKTKHAYEVRPSSE